MKRCVSRGVNVWVLLSALLCCCGCSVVGERQVSVPVADSHTSMNALSWAGTYMGTLPCADCAGIETLLTLTPARTYVLHSRYLGRQEVGDGFVHSGVFAWTGDGRNIELLGLGGGSTQFQVGENRLFTLDQAGVRIDGVLAQAYTLTRSADIHADDLLAAVNVFAGTAWHLVELYGEPLLQQESAPWLVFESDSARVHGFSGCNRFFGAYKTGADAQLQVTGTALPLKFGALGATMMACPIPAMEYEAAFLAMLGQVVGVYVQSTFEPEKKVDGAEQGGYQHWWAGNTLVFINSTHSVVARFRADIEK